MGNHLKSLILLIVVVVSLPALAGQPEREKRKEESPKVDKALADAKKACGCAPTIKVDWDSYKSADDMGRIGNAAESVAVAQAALCTDADNKKAFCKGVKGFTVNIKYVAGAQFEAKDKAINCGTDSTGYCGEHQFKQVFEKW